MKDETGSDEGAAAGGAARPPAEAALGSGRRAAARRAAAFVVGASGPAAAAAVFLAIAALAQTRLTDTDIWWHLASGDQVRSAGIPRAEPFSYTAIGRRWLDVHWLFQTLVAPLYARGGPGALDALRLVCVLGLFAFLFVRCRRAAPLNIVLPALLLAALACQERFLVRPEIVSWLFFAVFLAAAGRALDAPRRERRVILWLVLPALQIVWVNVQALSILGPAVVALALAAAVVERRAGGRDVDRMVDLLAGVAALAVAGLLNPYGAGALRLPLEQFFVHLGGDSLIARTIAEFQPPLEVRPPTPAIVAFVVLAGLTAVVLLVDARGTRPFEALVAAATLIVALRARRNIPIFVIAAAPILVAHGAAAWRALAAALRRLVSPRIGSLRRLPVTRLRRLAVTPAAASAGASFAVLAVSLVLAADVVSNRFFLRSPTERWWGSGLIPYYFPEDAARFVAKSEFAGHVFHPLWCGGYLIHAWGGAIPVFIDGRNDPYLDDVLERYLGAVAAPRQFEEVAARYRITMVLWPHARAREGRRLLSYLARSPDWSLIHLDPAAAVYARGEAFSPGGAPDAVQGAGPGVYETLRRDLAEHPFEGPPIREIALAESFGAAGDPGGAVFFYERALEALPRSAPVLHDYALALERLGRSDEALAAHRRALQADGRFTPSLAAAGALLLERGEIDAGGTMIDEAYRRGERGQRLLLVRARLMERHGDLRAAVDALREALRAAPGEPMALAEAARFQARHDQPEVALQFYEKAAAADPLDVAVRLETAELLGSLGRGSAALEVARDAARIASGRVRKDGLPASIRDTDRRAFLVAAGLEARMGDTEAARRWLAYAAEGPPRR